MAFAKKFPLENHKHKLNQVGIFLLVNFLIGSEPRKHTYMLRYSHPHLSSWKIIVMLTLETLSVTVSVTC